MLLALLCGLSVLACLFFWTEQRAEVPPQRERLPDQQPALATRSVDVNADKSATPNPVSAQSNRELQADLSLDAGTQPVRVVDHSDGRPVADLRLAVAASAQVLDTDSDGRASVLLGAQYRFSCAAYGSGVIEIKQRTEDLRVLRLRRLVDVDLALSCAKGAEQDSIALGLEFSEASLPGVYQRRTQKATVQNRGATRLSLLSGRWTIKCDDRLMLRPRVIDTGSSSRFELMLGTNGVVPLSGRVSTEAGAACAEVSVRIVGSAVSARTDSRGEFVLPSPPPVFSLEVISEKSEFEPVSRVGPFRSGKGPIVVTIAKRHTNMLSVRYGLEVLSPTAVSVHSGSDVTPCSVNGQVVSLARQLRVDDVLEVAIKGWDKPVLCRKWREERDPGRRTRRYDAVIENRNVDVRVHDSVTSLPVPGCSVSLVTSSVGVVAVGARQGLIASLSGPVPTMHQHGVTDAAGAVAFNGVVGDCYCAKIDAAGYDESVIAIEDGATSVAVPLARHIVVAGIVELPEELEDWICVVQIRRRDNSPSEAVAKQGRFELRSEAGDCRVILRLGLNLSQLAPVDMGEATVAPDRPLVVDATKLSPVKLKVIGDPQSRRGVVLGDTIKIVSRTLVAPAVPVDNGNGTPQPVSLFPGDYYISIAGRSDVTGAAIVTGKVVVIDGSTRDVVVALGFNEKPMTVRVDDWIAGAEPVYLALPDGSYLQLDERGEVELSEELPEGAPLQLAENRNGHWSVLGGMVYMRRELGPDQRSVGVVSRN